MSRTAAFAAVIVALLLGLIAWRLRDYSRPEIPFEAKNAIPSAAPLCPWREPENDLTLFFPGATRYQLETAVLSSRRLEMAERLRRTPSADENVLHIFRVYEGNNVSGAVLTRRVKGSYGAIEVVLGVSTNGAVRGLRLQRLREPEAIASALQNPAWLEQFVGANASSPSLWTRDFPQISPEAKPSADAIVEGIQSLLVLLATAEEVGAARSTGHRHH